VSAAAPKAAVSVAAGEKIIPVTHGRLNFTFSPGFLPDAASTAIHPQGISQPNSFGVTVTGQSGGQGGNAFQDRAPDANTEVAQIRIWGGNFIDAVELSYRNRDRTTQIDGPKHGGPGGTLSEPLGVQIELQPGEFIVQISGRSGNFVDSMQIQTNFQLLNRCGGQGGANDYVFQAQQGEEIVGFVGKGGNFVDAIGVLIRPRPF
jgi:hypothetical protein